MWGPTQEERGLSAQVTRRSSSLIATPWCSEVGSQLGYETVMRIMDQGHHEAMDPVIPEGNGWPVGRVPSALACVPCSSLLPAFSILDKGWLLRALPDTVLPRVGEQCKCIQLNQSRETLSLMYAFYCPTTTIVIQNAQCSKTNDEHATFNY